MRKIRFFSEATLALGAEVKLSDSEAIHAVRVLRMQEGDSAILFNGDGFDYACQLVAVKKSGVLAKVTGREAVENESPLNVTLLQGVSSGDRMDYTIQKAVELGVNHIQPIATERSVVKLTQTRAEKRLAHWQGIVTSACEQCGRAVVPTVAMPVSLSHWLANHPEAANRFLLNPVGARRLVELAQPSGEIQLLIGAEGGLSQAEIDMAMAHGFASVVLGPRVLRTETAALVAIRVMQALWGAF